MNPSDADLPSQPGRHVAIVGAGPGDPELLTLKAARLIGQADVVLYDRLVSPQILAMAPSHAELIDVGKRPGGSHTQDVLNDLLVAVSTPGRNVVRLKGGDPFMFGRGGEEAEVLVRNGISYEIVPGISSALAAPAAVGIPVTHRNVARAVTVVTGHEAIDSSPVDWSALARVGSTLVVLMGIERRGQIAHTLIAAGFDAATPVAVIIDATTPQQRQWTGDLASLADAPVASPGVIVIGAVAAFPARAAQMAATRGASPHA
ncbi:MAG: uroporphyrinogen methyltransferase [Ilumatobacteraceae bacterium]|jgi:uroporphyrin-III C-methyltransferase|nr:uroporphyrinogen methyltransferase [Ilumatobacteraceae bacterium]